MWSANAVVEPGVVRNNSLGRNMLLIGEPDGSLSKRAEAIRAALDAGGIGAPVSTDMRSVVWSKLLGNIAFAPGCCLTGATVTDLKTVPELREFCLAIMREAEAVAAALGVTMETTPEQRMEVTPGSQPHKVSMLQDLEAGRPMEIDAILGVPRDLGRMAGVPTPTLDIALGLLRQLARLKGLYGT